MSDFVQETSEENLHSQDPEVLEQTNLPSEENESDTQAPEPNSMDNIIPVEKLKNGWFTIKNFVMKSSAMVVDKVVEVNNSEEVQNFKVKAGETATKAWETTKETAVVAADSLQPAMEKVAAITAEGANALYQKSTETYSYVASAYFTDSSKTQATQTGDAAETDAGSEAEGGNPFPSYTTPEEPAATPGAPMTL